MILFVFSSSLALSKEYLDKGKNEPEVQAYFKFMVETAKFLGADETIAKEELLPVLEFEMKLANISAKREDRRNKTLLYNPTTLGEFKTDKGLPKSWTNYIQRILTYPNAKIDINDSELVIINDLNFFGNLSGIMANTSNRVLANYLGK